MKSSGFTLLEVMIALLIFSIGLLGLARLQVTSLQVTSDSLYRTIATLLANDMIDRMRANPNATSLGVTSPYNNPGGAYTANPACYGLSSSGSASSGASCTSTQMAQNDFADWYAQLQGASATGWRPAITPSLPSAYGVVCIDNSPQDGTPSSPNCDNVVAVAGKPIFSVKIWWVERKDAASPGTQHQYVAAFSL